MSLEGLEKLDAWRKAKLLTIRIYREVITHLPVEEKYELASQLRRSAQSIPANIAEGYGRYYYQDNIRFCYIARGSLEETISPLALILDLGYASPECIQPIIQEADLVVQLINGYIAYLKRSKQGEHEPGAGITLKEMGSSYLYGSQEENDLE